MHISASDRKKLTSLVRSKAYRDAYVSEHVRASVAYQIQALREKMGLSQTAFAEKVGMKQSVISRLENPNYGKVTVQTLLQVALALDIAILVRFCSYPEFLEKLSNVSPEALAVDNIGQSYAAIHSEPLRTPQPVASIRPQVVHSEQIVGGASVYQWPINNLTTIAIAA